MRCLPEMASDQSGKLSNDFIKLIGAPGTIRTSDPQIRSLSFDIHRAVRSENSSIKSMIIVTGRQPLSLYAAYYMLTGNWGRGGLSGMGHGEAHEDFD
jgi:hypothetical protein